MGFTLFSLNQFWLHSLCHGARQRLHQWIRPDNDSLAVGTALDLTRSKSALVLENDTPASAAFSG